MELWPFLFLLIVFYSTATFFNDCISFFKTFSSSQDKYSVLRTQDTKIIPTCSRCSSVPNLDWSWRVLKISSQFNSTTECEVDNLILNSSQLFIPASALESDTLYKIQLNTTSLTRSISEYSSFEFRTNDLPRGGYCNTKPYESQTLLNAFQTSCYAWYDRDQPLSYEYWYSTDGAKYGLFFSGEGPASGVTFLKPGLPERGFVISVKVIIKDSLGESTVLFLTVKVSSCNAV